MPQQTLSLWCVQEENLLAQRVMDEMWSRIQTLIPIYLALTCVDYSQHLISFHNASTTCHRQLVAVIASRPTAPSAKLALRLRLGRCLHDWSWYHKDLEMVISYLYISLSLIASSFVCLRHKMLTINHAPSRAIGKLNWVLKTARAHTFKLSHHKAMLIGMTRNGIKVHFFAGSTSMDPQASVNAL